MFKTGSYCVYYDEIKNTIECCENINTKQDTIMIIVNMDLKSCVDFILYCVKKSFNNKNDIKKLRDLYFSMN